MRAEIATNRVALTVALACLGALASVLAMRTGHAAPEPAAADPATPAAIAFPQGYTRWAHVKSGLIPAGHPAFARYGGLHHIYANDIALAGYGKGEFADGSVLAYDLFETRVTADGSIDQGPRRHVDVMVKDARRYAATGGWGYAEFAAGQRSDRLSQAQRGGCAACHAARKDQGYVFSELQG
ncbi:MAG: cytochrome P460 family protein [Lysobacter sp.]|nr:cytochrome P460 family protein [Lysobacter sp.]